jgi:hypothetical protein
VEEFLRTTDSAVVRARRRAGASTCCQVYPNSPNGVAGNTAPVIGWSAYVAAHVQPTEISFLWPVGQTVAIADENWPR